MACALATLLHSGRQIREEPPVPVFVQQRSGFGRPRLAITAVVGQHPGAEHIGVSLERRAVAASGGFGRAGQAIEAGSQTNHGVEDLLIPRRSFRLQHDPGCGRQRRRAYAARARAERRVEALQHGTQIGDPRNWQRGAVRFLAAAGGIARFAGVCWWRASPEASGENPGDKNDGYQRVVEL